MNTSGPETDRRGLTTRRELVGAAAGGAALLAAGGVPGGFGRTAVAAAAAARPKRGGNLRVGMLGGTSTDSLDAHKNVTFMDNIRVVALYDGLVELNLAGTGVNYVLAEEMIPNKTATSWTIRLRPHVTFHNGKPLTAADVIYTLRRIANPKAPLDGGQNLSQIHLNGLRALDKLTVLVPMNAPLASFPLQMANWYNFGIVPVGYDPQHPIGAGPFKYHSFTPGQQSVFTRYADYWQHGKPYLDQLTISDLNDETAAFNAVQSGQLDIYANAAFTLVGEAQRTSGLAINLSLAGEMNQFTMRCNVAPFTDVRVRQAFRLIANRPQLAGQAYSGFAEPAFDHFGWFDPCYDASLTRRQDIAQAKSLLKQAGHGSGLSLQLITANIAAGAEQQAVVFAQQAAAAGVKVQVRTLTPGQLYGPSYKRWTFAMDSASYAAYLPDCALETLGTAPYNAANFNNARYNKLYAQANSTLNHALSCEIQHEMQQIDFNEGGMIIATRNKLADIHAASVHGLQTAALGLPAGNAPWADIWLS